ncbi:MAG: tetratricopeptide repeat protein [Methylococcaceae bacterium]
MSNVKDQTLNLYNPAAQDPEQLLAEFIDRKSLLEKILAIVRGNTPDRPQQHLVMIGSRGMGKTTLLCAIKHTVERDPVLNADWLPILFHEEQYGIGDLADFWLECLRHLQHSNQAADQLLVENSDDLAARAQQTFFELLTVTGKRALLLIDNLNDIFAAIGNDQALHSLRALWMTDQQMMVIGAAPSYFAEITEVDQVFHDFFRTFLLDRLTQNELEDFLRRYAEIQHDDSVLNIIEHAPERVAALRILTGGNPRLVKLGYRVLRDGLDGDLRHDLERMLDEATPFFKHRIDSLSKEARRTFDAIARRWDPVTVDDIRRELRKPSNSISVQIKRLIDEGFVEEAYGSAKKKSYQVSERFYNVYYLMRHSREGRKRLRWLVGFMQTFYTKKDFKDWAKRLETDLTAPLSDGLRAEKLAHLHALSEAADDDSRLDIFEAMVRDAIANNDRTALDEEIAEGDPIEKYGWHYLYAEVVWLLPVEIRRALGFKPNAGGFDQKLWKALAEHQLTAKAEAQLIELCAFKQETAKQARAIGVVLGWLFDRQQEAEAACRKAITLDPEHVEAWNNLSIALYEQNRYEEAEAACRKAIELDPVYAHSWNGLGVVLDNQNRYEETEAAYRKAIELDPFYVNAWNGLGNALYKQNRHEETEAAYRKAIELDPSFHYTWSNLAGTYLFDLKRTEAGIAALAQGLALNPDYDYGRYVLKNFWQLALPTFAQHIASNQDGADNIRIAMTDELLAQAANGNGAAVLAALQALDETAQQPFEPLLLALQAVNDRSILYRIAREKRDLVLDVMARINGENKP